MTELDPLVQERADGYALLAQLLLEPDPSLIAALALAPHDSTDPAALAQAWSALVHAAARRGPAIRAEYRDLFISTGTPRLNPYECQYRAGCLMDKPLAALRDDLSALGLARSDSATELEDHLAALCETMHLLVRRGDAPAERSFFERHLAGWYGACLRDIREAPGADFYRAVAIFAQAFLEREAQALAPEVPPAEPHVQRQPREHEAQPA